jgi:hypothetical protein
MDDRTKVVLIFLTDMIDCRTAKLLNYLNDVDTKICRSFRYQVFDKVIDLLSHCLLYLYLGLSPIYLVFILWRLVGIVMFVATEEYSWLIMGPDVFRELLLFELFISPKLNITNVSIITLGKVIFEYFWH